MPIERCPGCGDTLEPDRADGVHTCPGCEGRFVEASALRKLGVQVAPELRRHVGKRPRACAACTGGMATVTLRGVTLDLCDPCGALYFDAGELEALRRSRTSGEGELECDGCGTPTLVGELTSRDGKALCRDCLVATGAPALSERDFGRAQQHARDAEAEEERADRAFRRRGSFGWGTSPFYDDSGYSLLESIVSLFR